MQKWEYLYLSSNFRIKDDISLDIIISFQNKFFRFEPDYIRINDKQNFIDELSNATQGFNADQYIKSKTNRNGEVEWFFASGNLSIALMSHFGQQGWEMVGFAVSAEYPFNRYIFKRPLKE